MPSYNFKEIWNKSKLLPWCTLVTSGRSGTDFFQSLLDSHPEIYVYNGTLYFHTIWESSLSVRSSGEVVLADFLDEFVGANIEKLKSYYEPQERKEQLGDSRDKFINIDTDHFRSHVLSLLEGEKIDSANVLRAIYISYAICLGQDLKDKKLFFHHIHHVRKVDRYMLDFPESKIICMIRDPRALYVSGVENWRKYTDAADIPSYPLYILWRAVDEKRPLSKYNDGRLKILRLEDLSEEKTLYNICEWLNLNFCSTMTESTWAGMRWWGDQVSQNGILEHEKGFSKNITTNNWEKKLNRLDKFLLNYLLYNQLDWYAYNCKNQKGFLYGLLVTLIIPFPTGYEQRYLAPKYLLRILSKGNIKGFLRCFYHPLRRIIQYYRWFYRRNFEIDLRFEYFNNKN